MFLQYINSEIYKHMEKTCIVCKYSNSHEIFINK